MIARLMLPLCALALAMQPANSQDYPTKPVTLIVPFAPGGPTDLSGRAAAEGLTKQLGRQVIVENKPGATGIIGLETVERSAPDGHTLVLFVNTTGIAHIAQKKTFNVSKQMIPLGNLVTSTMMVLVNPNTIDVKNLSELTAHLRKNDNTLFTSSGTGSPAHIYTEAWAKQIGAKMTHVSYRGISPALADVLGGRVGIILATANSVRPLIDAGKLRVIAVLGDKRVNFAPDAQTSAEQGFPDFRVVALTGLAVTPGTPQAIVQKLRKAQEAVVNSEEFRKVYAGNDTTPEFIDGPEWGALVQKDYDRALAITKNLGLTVE